MGRGAGVGGKLGAELEDAIGKGLASSLAVVRADDLQSGKGGCGNRWRGSGGEEEGSTAIDQVGAEGGGAGGKTASGTECLTEGSNEDVGGDPGFAAEAPSGRSERAD
jgi:hypothetical protein